MTELLRLQLLFTHLAAGLDAHIWSLGLEFSYGECTRSDEQAEINALVAERPRLAALLGANGFAELGAKILNNGKSKGIRGSLHELKLARDYNLFRSDGTPLFETSDHEPIGTWWERQDPLCCWGGRFGDGDHYSVTFGGKK